MVCRAAVKVWDFRQTKEIVIPCHRHCDAFHILKEFGYKKLVDYKEIAQGFLNEKDEFMTRIEAWHEAKRCNQFTQEYKDELLREMYQPETPRQLYSEDIW